MILLKSKKLIFLLLVFIFGLFILSGCGRTGSPEGELVVYNARNETFVKPLLDRFEKETGIQVRILSGREELVNQIIEEQNNVRADVFISNDAGAMDFLRREGLLAVNGSALLESIGGQFRAPDGSWVGLSARSRVLIYNKDLISEEEMPQTLQELADPAWAGRFMITRGGNSSMVTHVAALRLVWGDDATREWLSAVKDNAGAIVGGHTDIRQAVGAGEFEFGLVNNYYYHLQLEETTGSNVGAVYPDQGPDDMGVFVNVAGLALINGAPNEENARRFIDWMLEEEQQAEFSYYSKETPLNSEVRTVEEARRIDQYKVMDLDLADLGPLWNDARALIEESGLDLGI